MTSFIYPIIVGLIAFAGLSVTCWMCDRLREGRSEAKGRRSGIADQGEDWTPF